MKCRGILGVGAAAIMLAGCGGATRTVTQTVVVKTVTGHGSTPQTLTQPVGATATTTAANSSDVASNGVPWQCPSGDTLQHVGQTLDCYSGSVIDPLGPYVPIGTGNACPSGTEQSYLPNDGPAVCEYQR